LIGAISRAVSVPLQVGGGIRSMKSVETILGAGAFRVVLGTAALEDRAFLGEALGMWGERIAVSLDSRAGVLATRGWHETTQRLATVVASEFAEAGVQCLIYTDISRDGTLEGPDIQGTLAVQKAAGPDIEVIASGGISSVDDLLCLRECGVSGAIVGKALYDGRIGPGAFSSLEGGGRVAER